MAHPINFAFIFFIVEAVLVGPKRLDLYQEDGHLDRWHRNLVDAANVPHTRSYLSSLLVYRDVGMVEVHRIYRHPEAICVTHCLSSY